MARAIVAGRPIRLPHARSQPGLYACGGQLARHGYRRELRRVQLGRRAAASAADGGPTRRGRDGRLERCPSRDSAVSAPPTANTSTSAIGAPVSRTSGLHRRHLGTGRHTGCAAQTDARPARQRQFLQVMGVEPELGRDFPPGGGPGPRPRRRPHSQPQSVGAAIRRRPSILGRASGSVGSSSPIVGVAPERFTG